MPTIDGREDAPSQALRDVFDRDSLPFVRTRVDGQKSIYATGDEDDALYLIDSGQVKLTMSSASGQDCLLAIYTVGDVFGESCLTGGRKRFETATAMQSAVVRRVTRRDFLAEVYRSGAFDSLVRHVAARLCERQTAVFDLVTMDAERRLAKVLLAFAEKLGTADGEFIVLEQRISHEDLSQIVGTTRPRITNFMQRFRKMGIIQGHRGIHLHRQKAREFLGREKEQSRRKVPNSVQK
ncbi:MAG TPA: Crp/Fnr family transcriptional regulator [Thermoanaerobaculia bacterium]|nr:Crp/Fnr family transcriptional regulator [Thermoanaerobaculia bacterium]